MLKDLEAVIGYKFHNISLLQNALTHSSYANERWHNSLLSNERLEFLGDSVLGMLVAEYLYRNFPNRPEGELTRMRADMVCEQTLAAAAERIGLGKHLLLGHGEEQGGGRTRSSILADAMESVIAASFLDGGKQEVSYAGRPLPQVPGPKSQKRRGACRCLWPARTTALRPGRSLPASPAADGANNRPPTRTPGAGRHNPRSCGPVPGGR